MKGRLKLIVSLFSIAAVLTLGGVAMADDPPAEADGDAAAEEMTWEAPAEVEAEVIAMGEKTYKKCRGCHGKPDKAGKLGPHLFATMNAWDQEDEEAQKAYRKHTWEIIRDGHVEEVDGKKKKMPAFGEKLSRKERRAVIYYILQNRLPAEGAEDAATE